MKHTLLVSCEKCRAQNRVPVDRLNGNERPVCGKCKFPLRLGSGRPWDVTDKSFDDTVLHAGIPVLVDFWAPWCGPCQTIAPILEKTAARHARELHVARLNVDTHPTTAQKYGISGIPTLLLFKSGSVVDRLVGAVSGSAIESMLQKHGISH